MTNNIKHDFFDFFFSVVITAFTILLVIGQIVFLTIGLTVGIANWETEGILAIGLGLFGLVIAISLSMTLFGSWRFWAFDSEGVTNGNLLWKRKFSFSEVESVDVEIIPITGRPVFVMEECLCFHKGKKVVAIPFHCLSKEELEWLKQQASINS